MILLTVATGKTGSAVAKPLAANDISFRALVRDPDQAAVRRSIDRGSPYGAPDWTEETIKREGLESTIRPRGRPRKKAK